eukprot:jgi/Chrzof1/5478/Cz16g04240.t1
MRLTCGCLCTSASVEIRSERFKPTQPHTSLTPTCRALPCRGLNPGGGVGWGGGGGGGGGCRYSTPVGRHIYCKALVAPVTQVTRVHMP